MIMFLRSLALISVLALAPVAASTPAAEANERDMSFFSQIQGKWRGPGEIVAGKYKGTKFTCEFSGLTPRNKLGMTLDGGCRVGVFAQKMKAEVRHSGGTYTGTFLDGARGEGLDVVAGNVSRNGVVLTLRRKQLRGAMLARMASRDQLNITVSVNVGEKLVPVIGMKLGRLDGVSVGSVK
jgi:hypothetical protein